jgi:hypothetical protein
LKLKNETVILLKKLASGLLIGLILMTAVPMIIQEINSPALVNQSAVVETTLNWSLATFNTPEPSIEDITDAGLLSVWLSLRDDTGSFVNQNPEVKLEVMISIQTIAPQIAAKAREAYSYGMTYIDERYLSTPLWSVLDFVSSKPGANVIVTDSMEYYRHSLQTSDTTIVYVDYGGQVEVRSYTGRRWSLTELLKRFDLGNEFNPDAVSLNIKELDNGILAVRVYHQLSLARVVDLKLAQGKLTGIWIEKIIFLKPD